MVASSRLVILFNVAMAAALQLSTPMHVLRAHPSRAVAIRAVAKTKNGEKKKKKKMFAPLDRFGITTHREVSEGVATSVAAASIAAVAGTVKAVRGDHEQTSAEEDVELAVNSTVSGLSFAAGASVVVNVVSGMGKAAVTTAAAAVVGPAFKLIGAAGAGVLRSPDVIVSNTRL